MKVELKDKTLIREYLGALRSTEKILWQNRMGIPHQYLENYNPSFINESLFFFLFIFISFNISNGGVCFLMFLASIPGSMFTISLYRSDQVTKLELAREQTQYLITNKRIIFILYHNEAISVESILYENIKRVYSSKQSGKDANICIETHEAPGFQTFKYWSQKPHEKIVMVQIKNHERALDLIQENMP